LTVHRNSKTPFFQEFCGFATIFRHNAKRCFSMPCIKPTDAGKQHLPNRKILLCGIYLVVFITNTPDYSRTIPDNPAQSSASI
jgi:hypothetical protein